MLHAAVSDSILHACTEAGGIGQLLAAAERTVSPLPDAPAHEQEPLGLGAAAPCGAGSRLCRRGLGSGCVCIVILRQHKQLIPCACRRASACTIEGFTSRVGVYKMYSTRW